MSDISGLVFALGRNSTSSGAATMSQSISASLSLLPAGTVIKVFVKDLQEFDSEFHAKLDEGLVAAESNKAAFKQGLVAPSAK